MNTRVYFVKNNWLPKNMCGWGNGYIVLPKEHRFHGKSYDDIMNILEKENIYVAEELTYANEDEEGNWVVGWDSAHSHQNKENYPFGVVKKQTLKLQKQLG